MKAATQAATLKHFADVAELDAKFHATLPYQIHKCVLRVGEWATLAAFADVLDAFEYAHALVDELPRAAGIIVTIYDGVACTEVERWQL